MSVTVRPLSTAEHLAFIRSRSSVSFLQTPAWARVKTEWRSESLGLFEGRELVGATLVLHRPVPKLKRYTLAYLPEGPAADWSGELSPWLDPLTDHLKRNGAFGVRMGPPVATACWRAEQVKQGIADESVHRLGDLTPSARDAVGAWSRLDALVNNASSFYPTPIGETTPAEWDDLFVSNARAPFFLAQALRPAGYDGEVVLLIALLQNLGRLLVQYHFADEAAQIRRLMQPVPSEKADEPPQPGMSEEAASLAVLGVDIESLGAAVARHWGLSDEVLHMVRRLNPTQPVRSADTDDDMLRATASAANEVFDALALLLFMLAAPVFTFFISPLFSQLSRRHEFQADAYAMAQASGADLSSALLKLYEDNASTLTPDPVYVKFYYSHPPALERLSRMHPLGQP